MKRVPMPADTNEQVVFSKRTMREAWPTYDASAFERDIAEMNRLMDIADEEKRRELRADTVVNTVMGVAFFVVCLILMVSGE